MGKIKGKVFLTTNTISVLFGDNKLTVFIAPCGL